MNSSSDDCSTFNTTESGMWENERKVCENAAVADGGTTTTPMKMNLTCTSNAKDYLPQFIVRRFGDECPIVADSCLLNTKFNGKTDELLHRYTVSWIEDGPIHQEIDRMSLDEKKKKSKPPKKNVKVAAAPPKKNAPAAAPRKSPVEVAAPSSLPPPRARKTSSSDILYSEYSSVSDKEINVELCGKSVAQPEVRKCDGPCAAMRAVNDLRILGRCDHAICSFCVVNAPMVPREDGSMGCCNKKCFACDIVNQIEDQDRRHHFYQQIFQNRKFDDIFKLYNGDIRRAAMLRQDQSQTSNTSAAPSTYSCASLFSSCSESGSSGKYDFPPGHSTSYSITPTTTTSEDNIAAQLLLLRLVILESSYFSTIKRHRFEEEIDSRMPLLAAVECVMGISAGRNLFNSTTKIFYCSDENMETSGESMLEMNAKEHACLKMRELASPNGMINILIDYTGKLIKDKRQPYKVPIKSKK